MNRNQVIESPLELRCAGNTIQLTEIGPPLGQSAYQHWFSRKARITLTDADSSGVRPVGFIRVTRIAVTKNSTEVANAALQGHQGHIGIRFGAGQEFVLKRAANGLLKLKTTYVLESAGEERPIQVDLKNWRIFKNNLGDIQSQSWKFVCPSPAGQLISFAGSICYYLPNDRGSRSSGCYSGVNQSQCPNDIHTDNARNAQRTESSRSPQAGVP